MKALLQKTVFSADKILNSAKIELGRARLYELAAALLGYRSYAALLSEEQIASAEYQLGDADLYLLNLELGLRRANELLPSETAEKASWITQVCAQELKKSISPHAPVFQSVDEFFESWALEKFEESFMDSDATASFMAGSNADEWECAVDPEYAQSGDLWASPTIWSIHATAELTGSYDPESDSPYNGHEGGALGQLVFFKAGRAGLIYDRFEDGGENLTGKVWVDSRAIDRDEEYEFYRSEMLKESQG